jgi:uncharacterized protein with ParB-like and HNH nuclease domain
MEKDLKNITEIFNKSFFRIPDYQRGYSWGYKQLEDFWEDLELLGEGYHYTGLLTYEKIVKFKDENDQKLKKEYSYEGAYIVDGQQRLTTISILLKCILNLFGNEDIIIDETKADWEKRFLYKEIGGYEYFLFGYDSDNPSNYFFKKTILEREVSNEESRQETIYTNNLFKAKKFFENKLIKMDKGSITNLFKKLVNKLKFNLYEVDSDLEVFVTFETMNNRGKGLSKLELLKNRLIYLSTKVKDIDQNKLRDEINDSWKKIYNNLGKNIGNILDDDDFLKDHWIMYFSGYNRKEANVFSKFLLNEQFTIKNIINGKIKGKQIQEYAKSLRISIENYFFIKNPSFDQAYRDKYGKSIVYLDKLNRLGFSSFLPLIMSCLNKEVSDEEMVNLLASIERFIFKIFKINRYLSNFNNTQFYSFANKFMNGELELAEINDQLKKLIEDSFDVGLFKAWISNRFNRKEGYYSWPELRYFLFEYEVYLKNNACRNEDKILWNEFVNAKKDYVSIEHIFPQSKIKNSKDKIKCHSLGNMVPLSNAINSKLQDDKFLKKCERYKEGSLSERELCEADEWGEEEIKIRGLKLLDFMAYRWKITFPSEEFKLELLGFGKNE